MPDNHHYTLPSDPFLDTSSLSPDACHALATDLLQQTRKSISPIPFCMTTELPTKDIEHAIPCDTIKRESKHIQKKLEKQKQRDNRRLRKQKTDKTTTGDYVIVDSTDIDTDPSHMDTSIPTTEIAHTLTLDPDTKPNIKIDTQNSHTQNCLDSSDMEIDNYTIATEEADDCVFVPSITQPGSPDNLDSRKRTEPPPSPRITNNFCPRLPKISQTTTSSQLPPPLMSQTFTSTPRPCSPAITPPESKVPRPTHPNTKPDVHVRYPHNLAKKFQIQYNANSVLSRHYASPRMIREIPRMTDPPQLPQLDTRETADKIAKAKLFGNMVYLEVHSRLEKTLDPKISFQRLEFQRRYLQVLHEENPTTFQNHYCMFDRTMLYELQGGAAHYCGISPEGYAVFAPEYFPHARIFASPRQINLHRIYDFADTHESKQRDPSSVGECPTTLYRRNKEDEIREKIMTEMGTTHLRLHTLEELVEKKNKEIESFKQQVTKLTSELHDFHVEKIPPTYINKILAENLDLEKTKLELKEQLLKYKLKFGPL